MSIYENVTSGEENVSIFLPSGDFDYPFKAIIRQNEYVEVSLTKEEAAYLGVSLTKYVEDYDSFDD